MITWTKRGGSNGGKIDTTGAGNGEKSVCLWIVILAGGFAGLSQIVCFIPSPPLFCQSFWPDKHHYSVC